MSIKPWVKAARLRTLPLALSCTLTGTALALSKHAFKWEVFCLAILTTVFLQVLSNFANDYGDYKKGTDTIANRQDRALASGDISEVQMKRVLILFSVLCFIVGLGLLAVSFSKDELQLIIFMVLVGLGAIWSAIKYTSGKNAYGYKGLGDVFVFLFFGLVGVLGTQFLYIREVMWLDFLLVIAIGGLSVAVLNLNNLRDIISDKESGKVTVPVRLGFKKAKLYHLVLFVLVWLSLICYSVLSFNLWYLVFVAPFLLHVKHLFYVFKTTQPNLLDAELKKVALSTFVISLCLVIIWWSSF